MMNISKVPPSAMDLERAILGALLIDSTAINEVIEIISSPEIFYLEDSRVVYSAILSLHNHERPIDMFTVIQEAKRLGQAVSAPEIVSLTAAVGSAIHVREHAQIVYQKYMQRQLIRAGSDLVSAGFCDDTDVFESVAAAESILHSVQDLKMFSFDDTVQLAIQLNRSVEDARANKPTGRVPVGIPGISGESEYTLHVSPGDMVVIAARPSMGKTATMLSMVAHHCNQGKRILLFSMEMTSIQLFTRLVAAEASVPVNDIQTGRMDASQEARYMKALARVEKWNLHIDDQTTDINTMRNMCRIYKQKHPDLFMVMADYINKITGINPDMRFANREGLVSYYSGQLKRIAKACMVPVIILSQLSRENERRGGSKRPVLSDLRESGAIEQDADIVLFPHREAYYGNTVDESGNDISKQVEYIVSKNRNGGLGNGFAEFDMPTQRISVPQKYKGTTMTGEALRVFDAFNNNKGLLDDPFNF